MVPTWISLTWSGPPPNHTQTRQTHNGVRTEYTLLPSIMHPRCCQLLLVHQQQQQRQTRYCCGHMSLSLPHTLPSGTACCRLQAAIGQLSLMAVILSACVLYTRHHTSTLERADFSQLDFLEDSKHGACVWVLCGCTWWLGCFTTSLNSTE